MKVKDLEEMNISGSGEKRYLYTKCTHYEKSQLFTRYPAEWF